MTGQDKWTRVQWVKMKSAVVEIITPFDQLLPASIVYFFPSQPNLPWLFVQCEVRESATFVYFESTHLVDS